MPSLTFEEIYDIITENFNERGDYSIWADMPEEDELQIGTETRYCKITTAGISTVSAEYEDEE